jgi:hypothetical protein
MSHQITESPSLSGTTLNVDGGSVDLSSLVAGSEALAPANTLPDRLRGVDAAGTKLIYPVSVNVVQQVYQAIPFDSPGLASQGSNTPLIHATINGPTLGPGFWIITIYMTGEVGADISTTNFVNHGLNTSIGYQPQLITYPPIGNASSPGLPLGINVSKNTFVPNGSNLPLVAHPLTVPGVATAVGMKGYIVFSAQQISATNIVINGVT